MVVGNQNHEAALRRALNRFAINNPQDNTNSPSSQSPTTPKLLIDTSSNYGDGASEKLIGKMVKQLNVDRNRLHIVTKVGYVQGQNLKLFRQGLFSGIDDQFVRYHEDCLHCIHPEFIRCVSNSHVYGKANSDQSVLTYSTEIKSHDPCRVCRPTLLTRTFSTTPSTTSWTRLERQSATQKSGVN